MINVPQEFIGLFKVANSKVEADKTIQQVIALRAGNVIYSFADHDITSGNVKEELQMEQQLHRDDNIEITELVCIWRGGMLDIPSRYFRHALIKMNPVNKEAKVLLMSSGGYIVKTLEEIG